MEIKLLAQNMQKDTEEYLFEYTEESTLFDIKKFLKIEGDLIDFPEYYDYPVEIYFFEQIIPYIEIDNKIYFDVNLDKVRVIDFINTFGIKEELKMRYNFSEMGGGALECSLAIIKNLLKFFELISNTKGASDCIKELNDNLLNDKNITNKKYMKNHNSFSIFDYIYTSNNWNHYILAEKINISEDMAKNLLKVSGYSWDNSKKIYTITDEIKEKYQEKILNVGVKLTQENEKKRMKKNNKFIYFFIIGIIILFVSIYTIKSNKLFKNIENDNLKSNIEIEKTIEK